MRPFFTYLVDQAVFNHEVIRIQRIAIEDELNKIAAVAGDVHLAAAIIQLDQAAIVQIGGKRWERGGREQTQASPKGTAQQARNNP